MYACYAILGPNAPTFSITSMNDSCAVVYRVSPEPHLNNNIKKKPVFDNVCK